MVKMNKILLAIIIVIILQVQLVAGAATQVTSTAKTAINPTAGKTKADYQQSHPKVAAQSSQSSEPVDTEQGSGDFWSGFASNDESVGVISDIMGEVLGGILGPLANKAVAAYCASKVKSSEPDQDTPQDTKSNVETAPLTPIRASDKFTLSIKMTSSKKNEAKTSS
jgi:hypothetical protein